MERSILAAWDVVKDRVLNDPFELRARLARRRGKTLSRPPRAWCLAVRSNDTRIDPATAIVSPTAAIQKHEPHSVALDARLLRTLCRRVDLEYGLTCDEVAQRLGVRPSGLTNARIRGILKSNYIRGLGGRWGNPVPIVYTSESLDPSFRLFARPDAVWTWTARFLTNNIPNDFAQPVQRVPHWLPRTLEPRLGIDRATRSPSRRLPPPPPDHVWYKWSVNNEYLGDDPRYWRKSPNDPGTPPPPEALVRKRKKKSRPCTPQFPVDSLLFGGWYWVCPACKKNCKHLYYPAPPMRNLIEAVMPRIPTDEVDAVPLFPQTFACWRCHRVRSVSCASRSGWNELITYLTAGLLYGHEVPKPEDVPLVRKRPYKPQSNRPAKRRQMVLRRLLNGWSIRRIALDLGVSVRAVLNHVHALCKQEGVADRHALCKKLGSPYAQPLNQDERAKARRAQIRQMLIEGKSYKEMMQALNTDFSTINRDTWKIYKADAVSGRRGLLNKLNIGLEMKTRQNHLTLRATPKVAVYRRGNG